ncbi:hypothetical protein BDZ89DRAFT_1047228 [Hymenopellis radicata]|nr:hypothetical protein BDZ89DRAFT_1047228 [Hymenopellis radicata]
MSRLASIIRSILAFVCGFGLLVYGPLRRTWVRHGNAHTIVTAVQRQHLGVYHRVIYGGWVEISSRDPQNHVLIEAYSRFGWRYLSVHFYGFNANGTAHTASWGFRGQIGRGGLGRWCTLRRGTLYVVIRLGCYVPDRELTSSILVLV